jgi:CMP-N-acetylneuraminic acid synthetase
VIGRAGSRGLPGKNALLLAGRPLICHTIDDARAAKTVNRIVVSTDGDAIAAAAESMAVPVVRRPPELAADTATVVAAVRHAVTKHDAAADARVIVILYANVPVRPSGLIDRAVDVLLETGADSVQSYCDVGTHHPYWMVKLDRLNRVTPFHDNAVDRRQDLPSLLIPDGGVIAVTRASLLSTVADHEHPHAFLGADRRGVETAPGEVIDVDTHRDLVVAEAFLDRTVAGGVA